jgi:intein/homing endonuclease
MSTDLSTLFVGLGNSAPFYYRVMLPARTLGQDYVGVYGQPPNLHYATGIVKGDSCMPNFFEYSVVVLQQPQGREWRDLIRRLRAAGTTVLVEVDDYLHGVGNQTGHYFRSHYNKARLAKHEECFKAANGLIVSTPHLARVYKPFNKRIWVCENGIDPMRYAYSRPPRSTINIGIVCATGHEDSVMPWLQATAQVMAQRENTVFVSIGQGFASAFVPHFGEQRAVSVPFTAIECYPAAMALLDIALAPGGSTSWHRAKCLDASTRVATKRGIIPIAEVAKNDHVWFGDGWCTVRATHREPAKPGLRIRTDMGYELTASLDHRLSRDGAWAAAKDLRLGERLDLAPLQASQGELHHERVPLFHTSIRSDWKPRNTAPSLPIIEIDETWAELLGLFVGDGNINQTHVTISCNERDMDVVERIVSLYADVGLRALVRGKQTFNGTHVCVKAITVSSTKLVDFLAQIGLVKGDGKRDVRVPEAIWRSPCPVIAAFLRGYFEADGCAAKQPKLDAASKDHEFLADIQRLLLVFGITSRARYFQGQGRYTQNTYKHLDLRAREALRFAERVGFISQFKRDRAALWGGPRGNRAKEIRWSDEIASIEPCLMEPVDIEVSGGAFVAGGVVSHNSQLRYLEAGVMGIPLVANPDIYPAVIDGTTGEHARKPSEVISKLFALVDDSQRREAQGNAAREDVLNFRTIEHTAPQWTHAIEDARRASRAVS